MERIFLVEDDKEISRNLALLLGTEGFNVTHTSTQKDSIAMLAQESFDLTLVECLQAVLILVFHSRWEALESAYLGYSA